MKEYIDLGLPSGILWASENEEYYYTYDEAIEIFGDNLPSKEQFKELINECEWEWDYEKEGYIVTGSNGNSIFLYVAGCRGSDGNVYHVGSEGYYWSSTPNTDDSICSWHLEFYWRDVCMVSNYRPYGFSVRLVKK